MLPEYVYRTKALTAETAVTVNPVGKATGRVFDPDRIDVKWK
jgi:hypothetical protein